MMNLVNGIKRGEVAYIDLGHEGKGSEQQGIRPAVIIQNDIGNKYSTTIIVAFITSQVDKAKLPTHVEIDWEACGLDKPSVIMLEQVRTISKQRVISPILGKLSDEDMKKLNRATLISMGMGDLARNMAV